VSRVTNHEENKEPGSPCQNTAERRRCGVSSAAPIRRPWSSDCVNDLRGGLPGVLSFWGSRGEPPMYQYLQIPRSGTDRREGDMSVREGLAAVREVGPVKHLRKGGNLAGRVRFTSMRMVRRGDGNGSGNGRRTFRFHRSLSQKHRVGRRSGHDHTLFVCWGQLRRGGRRSARIAARLNMFGHRWF